MENCIFIIFRLEANKKIGGGHLARCNQLAKFYNKINCKIVLVTSLNSKNFIIKYKTYSDVYFLNSNNEIDELKKIGPQVVIYSL